MTTVAAAELEPKFYHDYTVGWVCALPKEQTAALAMLDKRHPDLPKPLTDVNSYILGEIHGHNVVIACLPSGKIGNNPAVAVVTRMVSTFQSIRFGLLVGIGGGVPPTVRLGDVVVSSPVGQHPGVVQWDFGKAEDEFKRTGYLNNPPTLLLTALSKLRSIVEAEGTMIPKYMDQIKTQFPLLASRYTWNDCLNDPYMEETILAKTWRILVAAVSFLFGWWALNPRLEHTGEFSKGKKAAREPRIHYGLIASGNQVIKNARFRDSVNRSLGGEVLCFEMEAAGLMADFPCIIIRGICDYADSKKNKTWQEYAAAVAAAYAKEYLSHIPRADVTGEKPAKEIMSQVLNYARTIKYKLDREEDSRILDWVTDIDYGYRQSDIFRNRQLDTGIWFLESPEYQSWILSPKSGILFCHGIPGVGKTVITSIVVDHLTTWYLDDHTIGFAYIYCDYRQTHEQNFEHLLSSILKQFAQNKSPLPDCVVELYRKHQVRRTKPSHDEVIGAIRMLATKHSKNFIIVDAIDECALADNCQANFISALLEISTCINNVKLLITSRPIPSIMDDFKSYPMIQIRASDEDVRKYLMNEVSKSRNKKLKECQELIISQILNSVDGLFLLAKLHFQAVSTKTTVKKMKAVLEAINERKVFDADAYRLAYDGAMERIECHDKDSRDLAKQVLMWIVCAMRPLKASELQCALAIETGQSAFDEENVPDIDRMISVCAGLVTMDKESEIMSLVHYTTQEYFDTNLGSLFPHCQDDITRSCVTYLSYDAFETGPYQLYEDFQRERLRPNIFYEYAGRKWGYHASKSSIQASPLILGFLGDVNKLSASIQNLDFAWALSLRGHSNKLQVEGIHIAAYFGLTVSLESILSTGVDINIKDKTLGAAPLIWAAMAGQLAVAELLLDRGADIETKDLGYRSPLFHAARIGSNAMATLLLNRGADIETKNDRNMSPLSHTVYFGNDAMVALLLSRGANIETKDELGKTPLYKAAEGRRYVIAGLLLAKGANIEAKCRFGETPLAKAVTSRSSITVKVLLNKGADIETRDIWHETPLLKAVGLGDGDMVKLLLDRGADVKTKYKPGQTPLARAVQRGYKEMARLLAEREATIDDSSVVPESGQ